MTRRATVWAALGAVAVIGFSATLSTALTANAEPGVPVLPDPVTPALTVDPMTDTTATSDQSAVPPPSWQPSGASTVPATVASGIPAGQNPTPYSGEPVFAPPTFNSVSGAMVGAPSRSSSTFSGPSATVRWLSRPSTSRRTHQFRASFTGCPTARSDGDRSTFGQPTQQSSSTPPELGRVSGPASHSSPPSTTPPTK